MNLLTLIDLAFLDGLVNSRESSVSILPPPSPLLILKMNAVMLWISMDAGNPKFTHWAILTASWEIIDITAISFEIWMLYRFILAGLRLDFQKGTSPLKFQHSCKNSLKWWLSSHCPNEETDGEHLKDLCILLMFSIDLNMPLI